MKNLEEVLYLAKKYNFTVGAFNMHNLEMLPEMVRTAQQLGAPIIIQTSVSTAKYIGMDVISSVCETIATNEAVDVVLHLDHCENFEDIKSAIAAGYTSVMYDGSKLSFEQNVLNTQKIVEYAHRFNVSVEGELGTISGVEDNHYYEENNYTNPQKAQEFIEQTGVDALAISIGTQHGSYKGKTEINLELLQEINQLCHHPLVIHGGTGVKEVDIKECRLNGVRKFNVGTELLVAWTKTAQEHFRNSPENVSLRKNIVPCNEAIGKIIMHKIRLFNGEIDG